LISPPPSFYPIIFKGYSFLVRATFRKVGGNIMNRFKANQKLLFKAETVFNLRPLEKYEILFSFLDTSPLDRDTVSFYQ